MIKEILLETSKFISFNNKNRSVTTLFKLLDHYGNHFTKEFWNTIFIQVLFPIFEKVINEESKQSEWIQTTCHKSMNLMIHIFCKYYNILSFKFSNILKLLIHV